MDGHSPKDECESANARVSVLRLLLAAALLYASWLGMMAVHELGHVLHAWLSGGQVSRVSLPLIGFSHTELEGNPKPLFVAWGGAIWGVAAPALLWVVLRAMRARARSVAQFFAGFCFVANGAYLGVGSIFLSGDAGDLIKLGCPQAALLGFGAIAIPLGFWLWHRLGPVTAVVLTTKTR